MAYFRHRFQSHHSRSLFLVVPFLAITRVSFFLIWFMFSLIVLLLEDSCTLIFLLLSWSESISRFIFLVPLLPLFKSICSFLAPSFLPDFTSLFEEILYFFDLICVPYSLKVSNSSFFTPVLVSHLLSLAKESYRMKF